MMKEWIDNTKILPCACGEVREHLIYTLDVDDPTVWLHYQLIPRKWYKRIWPGIKYVLGIDSRYGMYGEMLIDETSVSHLEAMIDHIKSERDK